MIVDGSSWSGDGLGRLREMAQLVETSDLAVLRGVLVNSDLLTAISPGQLAYELEAGLLTQLAMALPDTRRVIGITRRADSMASPGANILMEEIERRCAALLAPVGVAAIAGN